VAKLKNSKLYQKFMQKKDTIVPTPAPKPPDAGKIVKKKPVPEAIEKDDSLVFLVPPPKQPIYVDTPLVNTSLSYSLDMFNKLSQAPPVLRSPVVPKEEV
jgi:hypothetical protein